MQGEEQSGQKKEKMLQLGGRLVSLSTSKKPVEQRENVGMRSERRPKGRWCRALHDLTKILTKISLATV